MLIKDTHDFNMSSSYAVVLEYATKDQLNEAFALMGRRFKGQPRKAQIARGIARYVEEHPAEVLSRLDHQHLEYVKQLLEQGKGSSVELPGVALYNDLQVMHLVVSYEDRERNVTHICLFNELHDWFAPHIDAALSASVPSDPASPDTLDLLLPDCIRMFNPYGRAIIFLALDRMSAILPGSFTFADFIPYQQDADTLLDIMNEGGDEERLRNITDLLCSDLAVMWQGLGNLISAKLEEKEDADIDFLMNQALTLRSVQVLLQRMHFIPESEYSGYLKFKKHGLHCYEFPKIAELGDKVLNEVLREMQEGLV